MTTLRENQTAPRGAGDAQAALAEPGKRLAIAAVLGAMVLVVLNAAVANVALPSIADSLEVPAGRAVWIVTAYQVALLMALLPCAALGERWGYRRVFRGGVALFSLATLLCALAPALRWLVAARILQGLGGAAVMSLGMALLRRVVPVSRLGTAIGWNAMAVALSSAAGPAIGAAILSTASWPWLFALHLPLGVLVLLVSRQLPAGEGSGAGVEPWSVLLHAGTCVTLVAGVACFPEQAQTGVLLLLLAALQLGLLVRRELPRSSPMIPFDLLGSGPFRLSVIASVSCFAGQSAAMVALPFYLQDGLGQGPLMVGLYMLPWPLTVACGAPFVGRLAGRWSTAWLCGGGGALLSTGLAASAICPLQGSLWLLVPFTMLCGLGFSLFNVANNRNMLLSAPLQRSGAAGGLQSTARLLGQTGGAVLMTLLFSTLANDAAARSGLAVGAALTLLAGLISLRQHGGD